MIGVFRDDIERGIRKLKSSVKRDGDLQRFIERIAGYRKPSIKKRIKHRRAVKRLRKGVEGTVLTSWVLPRPLTNAAALPSIFDCAPIFFVVDY